MRERARLLAQRGGEAGGVGGAAGGELVGADDGAHARHDAQRADELPRHEVLDGGAGLLADVEVDAAGAAVLDDEGGLGGVVEGEDAGADALVDEAEQRLLADPGLAVLEARGLVSEMGDEERQLGVGWGQSLEPGIKETSSVYRRRRIFSVDGWWGRKSCEV